MQPFFAYLDLGTEGTDDPRAAQRVRLTHGIYVTLGFITAPYSLLFGLLGAIGLAIGVVPIATSYLCSPLVTRRFGSTVSRAVSFTVFPFAISLYTCGLGEGTLIHLLFFPATALPFLVTSVRERALLAYGVAAPMVAYAVLAATDYRLLGAPALSSDAQAWVGVGLVPTTFAILISAVSFFAVSTARAQAHLDQRTAEMGLVLENVDQALVTIDRDGRFSKERSRAFDLWFGPPRPDDTLWSFFARIDERQVTWLKLGFEQLLDGLLPVEVALEQIPSRYTHAGRSYHLKLNPVGPEPWRHFLVVISDVTAEVQRQAAEAEQADFTRAVRALATRRRPFLDALAEFDELVERSNAPTREAVLRALHTLKGSAAVWGFEQLARAAHAAEDEILAEEAPPAVATATVRAAWSRAMTALQPLIGNTAALEVPRTEVTQMVSLADVAAFAAVRQLAYRWLSEPLAPRLEPLAEQARGIAQRLGRGDVTVRVNAEVRVDPALARALPGLVIHLMRNAVDHGLEPPDERAASRKPERGTLLVDAAALGPDLVVEVRDDGRGIDWQAVANKARSSGLPAQSHDDLVEALFRDGLSTREEATEVSGRGVGLSAVRAGVEALGGAIDVISEVGAGTTFRLRIPFGADARGELVDGWRAIA